MPRKPFTPLSIEQQRWLSARVVRDLRDWDRVCERLEKMDHDARSPICRAAHNIRRALAVARGANLRGQVWPLYPTLSKFGEGSNLTELQQRYLGAVACDAIQQLDVALKHFDQVGAPCCSLSDGVRGAIDKLGAINIALHYLNCDGTSGPRYAVKPAMPETWCGDGI